MDIFDERDDKFEKFISADVVIERGSEKTEIQQFFTDKTILITGGSGFVGIVLIEKLLRSCPDLKKIILILRGKRGKSVRTRIKEMFSDEIFDKMRLQNPNYWKKIQIMSGCCEDAMMGVDEDQIRQIRSEVNIVYHSAATVRFDEHIRLAYNTNVGGTKNMLEIAKGIENLEAFIYVSTAYSQSHLPRIEEDFYPAAITDEEMIALLKVCDDATLSLLTPFILNGRFNTYTMTKGMAEEAVYRYRNELPVAVFRPSIITATFNDPITCWTNNVYGATGVYAGVAAGFLRTLYCDPDCTAEIIPADRVASGLIALPLHMRANWYKQTETNPIVSNPVYNFVANQSSVLTWGTVRDIMSKSAAERKLASDTMIWVYHFSLEKNYVLWVIQYFIYHLLPAPFFVLMEKALKRKPMIWKGYIKLFKYTHLYSFFMVRSWQFAEANAKDLYNCLSSKDKLIFNCNTDVDWNYYYFFMIKGLGTFITKFNWNNEHKVTTRRRIMFTLDRIIIWSFRAIVFYVVFKLICRVMNSSFS